MGAPREHMGYWRAVEVIYEEVRGHKVVSVTVLEQHTDSGEYRKQELDEIPKV